MDFDARRYGAAASSDAPLPARLRDPDIITAEELAEYLGCTLETVNERAASGDLPGLKFGRGWIFPRSALIQFLSERALAEATRRREPAKPTAVQMPRGRRRNIPPPLL